jgi:hypothetical protein
MLNNKLMTGLCECHQGLCFLVCSCNWLKLYEIEAPMGQSWRGFLCCTNESVSQALCLKPLIGGFHKPTAIVQADISQTFYMLAWGTVTAERPSPCWHRTSSVDLSWHPKRISQALRVSQADLFSHYLGCYFTNILHACLKELYSGLINYYSTQLE